MVVGVICVRRTELVCNVRIILTLLIGVKNDNRNRGTCAFSFKDAGKNLKLVLFFPLGGNLGLTRLAPLHLRADECLIYLYACRTAVYDHSQALAVRLSKGGDGKGPAKCISHELFFLNDQKAQQTHRSN